MRAALWSGIAALTLMVGCVADSVPRDSATTPPSTPGTATTPQTASAAATQSEDHEHRAPHGGALVELGDEFAHVELVLDKATGTLTAFALDGEAERPIRLLQTSLQLWVIPEGGLPREVTLDGVANALTGETRGDTSQFQTRVPALENVVSLEGSIKALTVRGRQFSNVPFRYAPAAER